MSQLEFEGVKAEPGLTRDDLFRKRIKLAELFSPTAPVEEEELFAGRRDQFARLLDTVFQRGQHAIVYGDRGVGKTSLVNTFSNRIFSDSVTSLHFYFIKCFRHDSYYEIWDRVFKNARYDNGDHVSDDIDSAFDCDRLLDIVKRIEKYERPIFVLDEFDRIEDHETKLLMAETIKILSDEAPKATVIPVGIGRTIQDLLVGHESVARALRQIEMPRMSGQEVREIVTVRLSKVGMNISDAALDKIVTLSRGMPGYAHLIGMYSAYVALDDRELNVTSDHVNLSLKTCIEEAGESVRQAYRLAVHSSKPNAKYKAALLACALAQQNEFGGFTAASVRTPLSKLLGEDRDIPSYARHLSAFCSEERGQILEQSGTPKNYLYHFRDPMMQSFVIIKGIHDGLIDYKTEGSVYTA